jgi:2-methylisocitrate lyase-like PEP mutase family enzyme
MSGHQVAEQPMTKRTDLESRCDMLRSLHVPGTPLVLPNAWDVASAQAVVAAGFPVVATTSGAVAASLGYEDHERAPGDEMLAAAARIARGVNVPVTVDAEAGYGMEPTDLVSKLREIGAAGCNLEDTDYPSGELRDPLEQADWLRAVRGAASDQGYGLVINARIDVFLPTFGPGSEGKRQAELVSEALRRAHAYVEAGADCVFPILLWEPDALGSFISEAPGPVNVLQIPPAPSHAELAELGVARISYGFGLHHTAMERFGRLLESLPGAPADEQPQGGEDG